MTGRRPLVFRRIFRLRHDPRGAAAGGVLAYNLAKRTRAVAMKAFRLMAGTGAKVKAVSPAPRGRRGSFCRYAAGLERHAL
jgi:hypothetical protein